MASLLLPSGDGASKVAVCSNNYLAMRVTGHIHPNRGAAPFGCVQTCGGEHHVNDE